MEKMPIKAIYKHFSQHVFNSESNTPIWFFHSTKCLTQFCSLHVIAGVVLDLNFKKKHQKQLVIFKFPTRQCLVIHLVSSVEAEIRLSIVNIIIKVKTKPLCG